MRKGLLFVVSAPSGAGKTSLVKALTESMADVVTSVSHTTRQPRPGEENGRDYHFVSTEQFEAMIAAGEFLEHAHVFDCMYGTSRTSVSTLQEQGLDVILEIDWQGANQIRGRFPESLGIFILPPSLDALEMRLNARAQDSEEVINKRMDTALEEMSHYNEFDFLVINEIFSRALDEIKAIVIASRLKAPHCLASVDELIQEIRGSI